MVLQIIEIFYNQQLSLYREQDSFYSQGQEVNDGYVSVEVYSISYVKKQKKRRKTPGKALVPTELTIRWIYAKLLFTIWSPEALILINRPQWHLETPLLVPTQSHSVSSKSLERWHISFPCVQLA